MNTSIRYPVYCTLLSMAFAVTGCTTTKIYEQRSQRAPQGSFVKEIDEPSSRGLLSRVSPEQSDVHGRFTLSHDGTTLVFSGVQGQRRFHQSSSSAYRRDPLNLWKIPSRGGSPVKLTGGGNIDCTSPSCTADGKHIVYAEGGTLWRISSNGSGGRTRIPGSGLGIDLMPHVSAQNRVVFCSIQSVGTGAQSKKFFIWTCDLDGGNLTQMREGIFPMWSPNGNHIVFSHSGDIWMINANGTELTQLTNTPDVFEGIPSFSPRGDRIVYVSNEGKAGKPMSNTFNIWTMRIDGAEKEQVTELDSWDSWPVWGTDGIYFLSSRAAADRSSRLQRIWRLTRTEE